MHTTNIRHMNFYNSLKKINVPTILGDVAIRVGGTGPAMMFWPSLLMTGRMWIAQAEHFGKDHQIILIDPPGHGDSAALTRLFTFDECVTCIIQILDAVNCQKVYFVGNSWGGMIGATFAAKFPERIYSAVLMNCTASAAGIRQRIEFSLLSLVVRLFGRVTWPLMLPVINAFVGPTTKTSRPNAIKAIKDSVNACNVTSTSWAVKSVVPNRPDQHELLKTITVPVLIVAGEEDQTFPVEETRAMANSIPGSKFTVLLNTAHLAALENPDEVNNIIELHMQA